MNATRKGRLSKPDQPYKRRERDDPPTANPEYTNRRRALEDSPPMTLILFVKDRDPTVQHTQPRLRRNNFKRCDKRQGANRKAPRFRVRRIVGSMAGIYRGKPRRGSLYINPKRDKTQDA